MEVGYHGRETRDTKIFRCVGGTGCNKGDFYHDGTLFKRSNSFCGKTAHQKIVLVDGNQLTELMIEYNLGVSVVETYVVKRVDYDFFNDDL